MQAMEFRDRWVLVTGASSGLGEEMARQLAAQGAKLMLVARREDRLRKLARELETSHGTRSVLITADLAWPDEVERVYQEACAAGEVHAVILNAGITHFGRHLDLDWKQVDALLATNVNAVLHLAHRFLPDLAARGDGGGVLMVASMAGLMPTPFQAAYAGSKAFLVQFGQALAQELRGRRVSVTVYCPGGIDTAMTRESGLRFFSNTPFLQDVASCATEGLAALRERRTLYVPGRFNRLQVFMSRFAPRGLIARVAHDAYRRALDANPGGSRA